jgi:filamin
MAVTSDLLNNKWFACFNWLCGSGDHVPGSPFSLRVAGAPDPSKVRVYGPGIEHGVLATFQSRFICDTRGAGAGQLTVRIRGPKGL